MGTDRTALRSGGRLGDAVRASIVCGSPRCSRAFSTSGGVRRRSRRAADRHLRRPVPSAIAVTLSHSQHCACAPKPACSVPDDARALSAACASAPACVSTRVLAAVQRPRHWAGAPPVPPCAAHRRLIHWLIAWLRVAACAVCVVDGAPCGRGRRRGERRAPHAQQVVDRRKGWERSLARRGNQWRMAHGAWRMRHCNVWRCDVRRGGMLQRARDAVLMTVRRGQRMRRNACDGCGLA